MQANPGPLDFSHFKIKILENNNTIPQSNNILCF